MPDLEATTPGYVLKVTVSGEHRQVMAKAKLNQQCIDRPDLNAGPSAAISQLSCFDMIVAVRNDKRQRPEPFDDLLACLRPREPL